MAKLSDLPKDVIVKIWSFLPVKSVLRLKCVQKSWNIMVKSLVKTPSFVADHLYNSTNSHTSSYLISTLDSHFERKVTLLILNHNNGDTEVIENPYKVIESEPETEGVCAHCDGILCMANCVFGDIKLLNPATREFKLIPSPRIGTVGHLRTFNLGYDAVSDAYKVVLIGLCNSFPKAKVYKVGKGISSSLGSWRDVDISMAVFSLGTRLCCGGFIFWMAWLVSNDDVREPVVLSFDLHEEKFEKVSLPSEHDWGRGQGIFPWRKSIAWYLVSEDETTIEVWVMSAEKSWTKYLSVPNAHELSLKVVPKAFWKNGDEILMADQTLLPNFVSYNIVENKYRPIYSNAAHSLVGVTMVPYVDSFVCL